MGLTKEECKQSLNHLIQGAYSRWYTKHGTTAKPHYLHDKPLYKGDYKALCKIEQLINEHFETVKENTISFKHFHLLADSTLKSWSKNALLDYIHMLYHNWLNTDYDYNRTIDYANELQKELDELEEQHMKLLSQWGKSDNSPLKLEEVHGYMPLFDTVTNFWIMVTAIHEDGFGGYAFDNKNKKLYFNLFTFEENRFYRREVKENE